MLKWCEHLQCIFCIFFIIAFIDFCDTVLLRCCHQSKSLQRELITYILTVFSRLLKLSCSKASLSWWWRSEKWCNWHSSDERVSVCMLVWFSVYNHWLNCVMWSCFAACSDKHAANLCTFLLSESRCLLFWTFLWRDAESDSVIFQVCVLCLTVLSLFSLMSDWCLECNFWSYYCWVYLSCFCEDCLSCEDFKSTKC